jgi:hypothetical protein
VSAFFCVGLSYVEVLAMGRSPVQRYLPKYLNIFIVSEVNFESDKPKGPNRETYNKEGY